MALPNKTDAARIPLLRFSRCAALIVARLPEPIGLIGHAAWRAIGFARMLNNLFDRIIWDLSASNKLNLY
jgi:hypothetical protein